MLYFGAVLYIIAFELAMDKTLKDDRSYESSPSVLDYYLLFNILQNKFPFRFENRLS